MCQGTRNGKEGERRTVFAASVRHGRCVNALETGRNYIERRAGDERVETQQGLSNLMGGFRSWSEGQGLCYRMVALMLPLSGTVASSSQLSVMGLAS